VARIRHGSAKNNGQRGGRPFFFPGRVRASRRFPTWTGSTRSIQIPRPEDRLSQRQRIRAVHRGFAPRLRLCWYQSTLAQFYARFIQYIFSRYQANITVLSRCTRHHRRDREPGRLHSGRAAVMENSARRPSASCSRPTPTRRRLRYWGDDSWVTLHQTGNMREHVNYWYLTEIFNQNSAPRAQRRALLRRLQGCARPAPITPRAAGQPSATTSSRAQASTAVPPADSPHV